MTDDILHSNQYWTWTWGTLSKYQNAALKVARKAFWKIWNLVCCHVNQIVKLILWSSSSSILLQIIKHFFIIF